jgi:hypothetical protein
MKISHFYYVGVLASRVLQVNALPIKPNFEDSLQAPDDTQLTDVFHTIADQLHNLDEQATSFVDISNRNLQAPPPVQEKDKTKPKPGPKPDTKPQPQPGPSQPKPPPPAPPTKPKPEVKPPPKPEQKPPPPPPPTKPKPEVKPPSKPEQKPPPPPPPTKPKPEVKPPPKPEQKPPPPPPPTKPKPEGLDEYPFYKVENIPGAAAKVYHFFTGNGWQKTVKDLKVRKMLQTMNERGRLTVAEMQDAHTSCIGPREGFSNGKATLEGYSKDSETNIITNGGFFIHKFDAELRREIDDPPVKDPKALIGFTVGETTVAKNTVPPARVHKKYYEVLHGDDRSTLSSAPGLKNPIDQSVKELQYFAVDGSGKKIPNPPGHEDKFLRSTASHLPGTGLTTVNEPNERLATVVMPKGIKLVFAYTSERDDGVRINQLRDLINTFLQQYLGSNIGQAQQALNLDGGASIFIGLAGKGQARLLAQGGVDGALPPPNLGGVKTRDGTTMVKYRLKKS